MSEYVPESPQVPETDDQNERLQESVNEAWAAAMKALYAFILVLMILIGRTLQALFVLARPALLVATIVAAGYTSCTLFGTVLARYGGDVPAIILALAAVVIVPATLIIMAGDYGLWAVCLATASLEFLAHLGLQRAPPLVLALVPVLALSAIVFHLLFKSNEEEPNEQEQRSIGAAVDHDGSADHLHLHEVV